MSVYKLSESEIEVTTVSCAYVQRHIEAYAQYLLDNGADDKEQSSRIIVVMAAVQYVAAVALLGQAYSCAFHTAALDTITSTLYAMYEMNDVEVEQQPDLSGFYDATSSNTTKS